MIIFLLVTASHFCFAEVTGNAFLEGQTDHSGVKIKFIPNSPTAVLDSTFSIVDGSYSILLQPGVYYVIFSKAGYETVQYNDGNPVVIAANYILSDVTLQEGGSFIYLSGNVDGILTSENVYIVTDDITIPEFQMLYIEPGTLINLQEGCNINVYGVLEAVGTEEEKIVFTSAEDTPSIDDWGNLSFYYNAYDTCFLKHCKIEFGYGIFVESLTIIESCELCYLGTPINTYFGDHSHFINNIIHDFTGIGINVNNTYYLSIKNNVITLNSQPSGSYYTGIQTSGSTGIIDGNHIYCLNNQLSQTIEGIYSYSGNWQIYNNIIDNCNYGFIGSGYNFVIVNNIFSNNTTVGVSANGSNFLTCILQSNIVFGNAIGFMSEVGTNDINFSYNNVWDNNVNYDTDIPGIGQIIATNNNGDPCDPYFNITLDPMFVDVANLDFHVNTGSPVIDAGSNDYIVSLLDLDGHPRILDGNGDGNSVVDIGVYEFASQFYPNSNFTCSDIACENVYTTISYSGNANPESDFTWDFDGGLIISGSGGGPYYIVWEQIGQKTISLYVVCEGNYSDTTYKVIDVLPPVDVSVSINASTNPICTEDEVTFIAVPVNGGETPSYEWKLNTQTVGTNSPVYTNSNLQNGDMVYCYFQSSLNCPIPIGWVISNVVIMDIYNYPNVNIVTSPNDTTCITETITLNAGNPGCEYIWSTGESTQSIVVSNISGPSGGMQDYTVEVIKGGICSGYDTISVYFDPCTGIYNPTNCEAIKIYPNPAKEMLNIELTGISQYINISILSPEGKLFQTLIANPVNHTIRLQVNLSELPKGIYLLKIENDAFIEVRKFMRE